LWLRLGSWSLDREGLVMTTTLGTSLVPVADTLDYESQHPKPSSIRVIPAASATSHRLRRDAGGVSPKRRDVARPRAIWVARMDG
jgi:hypothetical protein